MNKDATQQIEEVKEEILDDYAETYFSDDDSPPENNSVPQEEITPDDIPTENNSVPQGEITLDDVRRKFNGDPTVQMMLKHAYNNGAMNSFPWTSHFDRLGYRGAPRHFYEDIIQTSNEWCIKNLPEPKAQPVRVEKVVGTFNDGNISVKVPPKATRAKRTTISPEAAINKGGNAVITTVPPSMLRSLDLSHDNVADMVVEYLGGNVACTDMKHKIVWFYNERSKLWKEGGEDTLTNFIMKVARPQIFTIRDRLPATEQFADIKELMTKLANRLGDVPFVAKAATLVRARCFSEEFVKLLDGKDDLLPLRGGKVITFPSKEVRDRTREDYFSFECPVTYDKDAADVNIQKFLNDITLDDVVYQEYLQRALGECLTGRITSRKIYLFYGPEGSNGKSTLTDMMRSVIGPFYVQAHKDVFLSTGSKGNSSPYVAELRGCRMAVFSEGEAGDKINEAQLKLFSGGDPIKARPLYKNPIEFMPHFKCFILTNNKLTCSTDKALWERLSMSPFNCELVDKAAADLLPNERVRDYKFKDNVVNSPQAMSTFFNWLIEGAVASYNNTLPTLPACVTVATTEYKEEQNIYAKFLSECLIPDPNAETQGKALYGAFVDWCKDSEGIRPKSNNIFGSNMKKIIGEPVKRGCMYYKGWKLVVNGGTTDARIPQPAPYIPPTHTIDNLVAAPPPRPHPGPLNARRPGDSVPT